MYTIYEDLLEIDFTFLYYKIFIDLFFGLDITQTIVTFCSTYSVFCVAITPPSTPTLTELIALLQTIEIALVNNIGFQRNIENAIIKALVLTS